MFGPYIVTLPPHQHEALIQLLKNYLPMIDNKPPYHEHAAHLYYDNMTGAPAPEKDKLTQESYQARTWAFNAVREKTRILGKIYNKFPVTDKELEVLKLLKTEAGKPLLEDASILDVSKNKPTPKSRL